MATIQGIYIALFGRPADPLGLEYFNNATNNGADLTAIGDLAATAEYQDRFDGMNNSQIVTAIYQSLFGRNPELAGLEFFVNALNNGTLNINNVAIAILDGAQGDDAALVEAKIAAAEQFTAAVAADADALAAYNGADGANFGRAFINQIDDAADELTDEEVAAQIATYVETGASPGEDPSAPSNQINFTSAVGEQLVGTAGNDAFNGVASATAANGTIHVGDTANGGAGIDTLNVLVTDATQLPAGFSTSNIEIVNITYADGTSLGALNSSTFSGVEQLWQIDNSAAVGTFQNVTVGAGVTAGFRSTNATATAQAAISTVTVANGVTDASVALAGVATGSIITFAETTATNLSTVNVSGTVAAASPTAAGQVTLSTAASTDIDTLNLSLTSAARVVFNADFNNLETINASGSTGNIGSAADLFNLTGQNELKSYVGGSARDAISIDIDNNVARTIDVGAGNDIVSLDGGFAGANNTKLEINLGTGADTFVVNSATLTNIVDASAANFEAGIVEVIGFGSDDVLDLSALGAAGRNILTVVEQDGVANATSLHAAVGLVAAATDATQYTTFQYDGSTYVFYENATDGFGNGDGLLELVGFTGALVQGENFFA